MEFLLFVESVFLKEFQTQLVTIWGQQNFSLFRIHTRSNGSPKQ